MSEPKNFLVERIEADLAAGTYGGQVVTRFPPEPNGYLHIGHAKAIVTDFGLAARYGGRCNLRFDDTNPEVEDVEYVESIQHDIRWLGFDWGDNLFYASDYFETLYGFAQRLIREGKAYVCSLSLDAIRAGRGTVTEAGTPSPDRDRPIDESLALLEGMRRGDYPAGAYTVRAKIDMAHPNMKMRDPLMYRIRHAHHHRTGDAWHIYPMYDYAHGLSDAIEGVTHSICTLEFENNRELYDWFVQNLFDEPVPHQHEMARLALTNVVLSKRKLIQLVTEKHVWGWDDPRMPTLAGLRRRGIPPQAIVRFVERVGIARSNSMVDMALLEHTVRDALNTEAPRRMGVLDPLRVVLTNLPADHDERLDLSEWPHDVPKQGSRPVPLTQVVCIDRDDFSEAPPKGYKRLSPGQAVRLRGSGVFVCEQVVHDDAGRVVELRGPLLEGDAAAHIKPKGTIHWVSATAGVPATVRLIDRLFSVERPDDHAEGFLKAINPDAMIVVEGALLEPELAAAPVGTRVQLERVGYFIVDTDSTPERPVLHRIVALKDSWSAKDEAPEVSTEPAVKKEPGRKRTRKSASDALDALIEERPEIGDRLDALQDSHGLSDEDAAVIAVDDGLWTLFGDAVAAGGEARSVNNWIVNDLRGATKDTPLSALRLTGAHLAELIGLVSDGDITSKAAKQVFAEVLSTGQAPAAIVDNRGLRPLRDEAVLQALLDDVIGNNTDKVQAHVSGAKDMTGFFVGQVMRASGGKADPSVIHRLVAAIRG